MENMNQQLKTASLNGFLEQLTPERRCFFIRRYWFCNSIEEIAEMYHVRPVTVRIQLFFARLQFRNHLRNSGVPYEDGKDIFSDLGEVDLRYVQESEE